MTEPDCGPGAYLDHEAYIAGALLIDAGTTLRETRELLSPESFRSGLYGAVYRAALELEAEGVPIDPATLREAVERSGTPLPPRLCVELMRAVPTLANLGDYAGRVAEARDARALHTLFLGACERLSAGEAPAAVRGDTEKALQNVKLQGASALVGSGEAMEEAYRGLMRAAEGERLFVGSGYAGIDRLLGGGFIRSGLHILAARPGTGKTTLALQIAENAAAGGLRTLFVSLEMSVEQLQHRRLALAAGLPLGDILNIGREDRTAWKKLGAAMAELSRRPLVFNRQPGLSVSHIERLARSGKAELLVIDYLGLIAQEGGRSLYERVTETSGALKRMAVSLGVPVLCLCQLNRGADGKRPCLSELRDSGAIEQDADTVLLQWLPGGRPERGDGGIPAELELIAAKNRHGPLGRVSLNWYMQCGRIRE